MTKGIHSNDVLLAVQRLTYDLAMAPHLGRPNGWTDEEMKLSSIGEALGAVLNFLISLDTPLSSQILLLQAFELVVEQKPRQRGGQRRNSGLICIAIQRLVLAGMAEEDAIKHVSDQRIVRENIADTRSSLKQVEKYWVNRANEESWKEYRDRKNLPTKTPEQAQYANDQMFRPLHTLTEI